MRLVNNTRLRTTRPLNKILAVGMVTALVGLTGGEDVHAFHGGEALSSHGQANPYSWTVNKKKQKAKRNARAERSARHGRSERGGRHSRGGRHANGGRNNSRGVITLEVSASCEVFIASEKEIGNIILNLGVEGREEKIEYYEDGSSLGNEYVLGNYEDLFGADAQPFTVNVKAGNNGVRGVGELVDQDNLDVPEKCLAEIYEIGGEGPAGGIVFSVSEDGTSGLEVTSSNNGQGSASVAIEAANAYSVGASDWRLPTLEELEIMRSTLGAGCEIEDPQNPCGIGQFNTDSFYWSSDAEFEGNCGLIFTTGSSTCGTSNTVYYRFVRAFN